MLLAGLWCSTQKPPAFTFLEPIFTSLEEMNIAGIANSHFIYYLLVLSM